MGCPRSSRYCLGMAACERAGRQIKRTSFVLPGAATVRGHGLKDATFCCCSGRPLVHGAADEKAILALDPRLATQLAAALALLRPALGLQAAWARLVLPCTGTMLQMQNGALRTVAAHPHPLAHAARQQHQADAVVRHLGAAAGLHKRTGGRGEVGGHERLVRFPPTAFFDLVPAAASAAKRSCIPGALPGTPAGASVLCRWPPGGRAPPAAAAAAAQALLPAFCWRAAAPASPRLGWPPGRLYTVAGAACYCSDRQQGSLV